MGNICDYSVCVDYVLCLCWIRFVFCFVLCLFFIGTKQYSFERKHTGGVCWIAAGGEVEEDEGSALQEAEKRRRQDEKAEKILQAYNDGYGQCN